MFVPISSGSMTGSSLSLELPRGHDPLEVWEWLAVEVSAACITPAVLSATRVSPNPGDLRIPSAVW